MHHGSGSGDEEGAPPRSISEAFAEQEAERLIEEFKLGATGEFPEGKLTPDDEGELRVGLMVGPGRIAMVFGKDVSWIGFTPAAIRDLAEKLHKAANQAEELMEPTVAAAAGTEGESDA